MEKPIGLILYKVVQNCNLNCKYCYVYNKGDDSWKNRPTLTSLDVTLQLAKRINLHCSKHSLNKMDIEIHGGEPLLLGKNRFMEHILLLRKICGDIDLTIFIQTNGLLLDRKWLEIFYLLNVTFSLSLDGPPEFADRNRIYRNGKGTTNNLLAVIRNLRADGDLFEKLCSGFLCVINSEADGKEFVEWFRQNEIDTFDFLLPDGNHFNPVLNPKGIEKFLIGAFNYWYQLGNDAPNIRFFKTAIETKSGFRTNLDALGGDISGMCVVESNGAIGCHDVLRICGGKYSQDDLNIFDNELGEHQSHYELESLQTISQSCLECKHFKSCGGGYLPHRFDGKSFKNPSYHCDTLLAFYQNVENSLRRDIPEILWKKVSPFT